MNRQGITRDSRPPDTNNNASVGREMKRKLCGAQQGQVGVSLSAHDFFLLWTNSFISIQLFIVNYYPGTWNYVNDTCPERVTSARKSWVVYPI